MLALADNKQAISRPPYSYERRPTVRIILLRRTLHKPDKAEATSMPTYALLGATGATGRAIVRYLLSVPPKEQDFHLKVFVRSRAKLLKLFPDLEGTAPFNVTIAEAPLTDTAALRKCLQGADVIHVCIASNESRPDNSIAVDSANAVIGALRSLSEIEVNAYTKPTLLVLRAMPVNKALTGDSPGVIESAIKWILHYCYADHDRASALYHAAADDGVLEVIFVDPPALHDSEGAERTGYELKLEAPMGHSLNYADLGAAFVEIAGRQGEFAGKGVGVAGTGHVREQWGVLLGYQWGALKARVWG